MNTSWLALCCAVIRHDFRVFDPLCADDEGKDAMVSLASLRLVQPFPATKIKFLPARQTANRDLLITSSRCLTLWHLDKEKGEIERLLDVRSQALRISTLRFV